MNYKLVSRSVSSIICIVMFAGCASISNINEFATTAEKGIADYNVLPITFRSVCLNDCKEIDIDSGKLNLSECDCKLPEKADSVDRVLFNTVDSYLTGLQKLSANEATSYNFDDINNNLSKLVPTQTSTAYTKLGSLLTTAFTEGYRKGKLKIYIHQANTPLQLILEYLHDNIGIRLLKVFNNSNKALESTYLNMVRLTVKNDYKRRQIVEDYYARKIVHDKEADELIVYANLLKTIGKQHQQLNDALDRPDKGQMELMLKQYANTLKELHNQINVLTK